MMANAAGLFFFAVKNLPFLNNPAQRVKTKTPGLNS